MSNRRRLTEEEFAELRALANDRCEEIVTSYLGQPLKPSRRELRWGKGTGSFVLVISGRKRGCWIDHDGSGGGMLEFFRQQNGGDWGRGIDDAIRFTGYAPPSWNDNGLSDEQIRILAENVRRRTEERAQEQAKAKQAEQQEIESDIRAGQRIASYTKELDPGSPGDVYLQQTRGIPCPEDGWPSCVRRLLPWKNQPESVMFLATDATGRIVGVQRVEVTSDGEKIQKRSRGAFAATGGVVRLPGPSAGPLQIAEGPETALSAWTATGFETWISLGSLATLALPAGRIIIACRDDDAQNSPADKALQRAVSQWRRDGHDVRVTAPWEVRRFDKSDFNDLIKVGGVEAVKAKIDAVLGMAQVRQRVPVEQARKRIRAAVSQFTDAVSTTWALLDKFAAFSMAYTVTLRLCKCLIFLRDPVKLPR